MNQREINRVEKYLITYPQFKNSPEALEALKTLCLDPNIGHPADANKQRQFRTARKSRDAAVLTLASTIKS
jgi:hypothetical protein